MRAPTEVATTARALRLNQTPLAGATPTERIPRRRTIHAIVKPIVRRMHVPSRRAILLQTGLTTRQELITLVRIQLTGPLRSIRTHNGQRPHRDRSKVRLNNSTARLDRKASPSHKGAIPTQNRNS